MTAITKRAIVGAKKVLGWIWLVIIGNLIVTGSATWFVCLTRYEQVAILAGDLAQIARATREAPPVMTRNPHGK